MLSGTKPARASSTSSTAVRQSPAGAAANGSIMWPDQVAGCAAVVERLVLPPSADGHIPDDASAAQAFAEDHPDRQEVRIVAGATRAGAAYCALRLRAHDDDQSVVGGADLVPALVDLLRGTLESFTEDEQDEGTTQ